MTTASIHPAHSLLSRAHSPPTALSLFTDRIKNKPLLLRPTSPTPATARHRRRHERLRKKEYFLRKQKPRPLSAREKRVLGVHDLDKAKGEVRYGVYEGLNRLWRGYVGEVLGLKSVGGQGVSVQNHGALLASLDFHGAEVQVVRCGCVGRVGTRGIVVRDTKFTFVVVMRGDQIRTIPKKDAIFRFEVPLLEDEEADVSATGGPTVPRKPLVFEVHGNQFEMRSADRANKKFKWKNMDHI